VHERLKVVEGNAGRGPVSASNVTNPQSVASAVTSLFGATALKQEPIVETRAFVTPAPAVAVSPVLERADLTAGTSKGARIAEARMKGYEGESCTECGNFTMVRNGTCLKCETCGSTSGCS